MNDKKNKRKRRPSLAFLLLIIFVLGVVSWSLPLAKIKAESTFVYKSRPAPVNLAWPAFGQSAVGAVGYGVLDKTPELW